MSPCARDVMQSKVRTVGPRMSLPELERAFLSAQVTGFPVVDGDRLVGVVSRSDVVRKLVAEQSLAEYLTELQRDAGEEADVSAEATLLESAVRAGSRLASSTVSDVMTRAVVTVAPDDSVASVARVLVEKRVHRVPVVRDGRLEGIITSLDLVGLVANGTLRPA